MKCYRCHGNNFRWSKRCAHCGQALTGSTPSGDSASPRPRIPSQSGPEIDLIPPTSTQLDLLRVCWPFGLQDWPGTQGGFHLICRRPDREVMVVKFQQVDVPLATATLVRFQNRVLIALALRGYLERDHRGLLMPCAYLRPKGSDRAETGIAYLVGPHPDFKSVSQEFPDERWDAALGSGATAMIGAFAREVGRVADQVPQGSSVGGVSVGRPFFLTMEVRPVSTMGSLDSRVAVLGPDVLVTMPRPESILDGAWQFVAQAGFLSLPHTPIAPVELREDGSVHPL